MSNVWCGSHKNQIFFSLQETQYEAHVFNKCAHIHDFKVLNRRFFRLSLLSSINFVKYSCDIFMFIASVFYFHFFTFFVNRISFVASSAKTIDSFQSIIKWNNLIFVSVDRTKIEKKKHEYIFFFWSSH